VEEICDTSEDGVVKSSLHFRTLRNGKTIHLVLDSDPDSLRATSESEVDLTILPNDKSLPSCKIVLEDCLSSIQTEKPKLLSVIQDKTHSEHSQQIEDKTFLQKANPKMPINWPKTDNSVA